MDIQDSDRLTYRLMTKDDAGLLFELNRDPEVMQYISGGQVPTMKEINDIHVPRMESFSDENAGWGVWGIFAKPDGDFARVVVIRPMHFFTPAPEPDNLEIGWRFKKEYWGRGYATEAARHFINIFLAKTDVEKFTAIANESNRASIKIMTNIGMTYTKTGLHKDPLGDEEVVFYERRKRSAEDS
jgi:RimJ/RimL family protein N-acetyltransferase